MVQFLLAVRRRKSIVVTSLLAAGLLGGVYYGTATRYYGAGAQILVMGSGSDGRSVSATPDGARQHDSMPTFESLLTSAKVVEGAVKLLEGSDRIDVAGYPQEGWAAVVQKNLSAATIRGTNIIELTYRSKDPKAAVSVVNAVYESYSEFLEETHKGTAAETIAQMTKAKDELTVDYNATQQTLTQQQQQVRDMGIRNGEGRVAPGRRECRAIGQGADQGQGRTRRVGGFAGGHPDRDPQRRRSAATLHERGRSGRQGTPAEQRRAEPFPVVRPRRDGTPNAPGSRRRSTR